MAVPFVSGYKELSDRLVPRLASRVSDASQVILNRNRNLELLIRMSRFSSNRLQDLKNAGVISNNVARQIESEHGLQSGWLDSKFEILPREKLKTVRINNLSKLAASEAFCDAVYLFLSSIISATPRSPADTLFFLFSSDYCSFEDRSFYLRSLEAFCGITSCSLDDPHFIVS